jgi:hypothetical protein
VGELTFENQLINTLCGMKLWGAGTLHPAPCTLHPAPCTLRPAPCTMHPEPDTLIAGSRRAVLASGEVMRLVTLQLLSPGPPAPRGTTPLPCREVLPPCPAQKCYPHARPRGATPMQLLSLGGEPHGYPPLFLQKQGFLAHKKYPPARTLQ